MIEDAGSAKAIFDVIAVFLSMNIIFWFTWAIYYNIKRVLYYKKKTGKVFFTTYFNLFISFLFTMVFLYIMIATPIKGSPIDSTSFGAIVIRPIILLEAVGTAINEMEKFRRKGNCE